MHKEGEIYFNKIYVIESIPCDENKTGSSLYNDIIARRIKPNRNEKAELLNVSSSEELNITLSNILEEVKQGDVYPFVHFEAHGFDGGLTLSNGDSVQWTTILPLISAINTACDKNLFISVSSCLGGYIQFTVKITQPCPFRGFIGPMNRISPIDLLASFEPFFNILLSTDDFEEAIDALNTYNTSGVHFNHFTAESFFEAVIQLNKELVANNSDFHAQRLHNILATILETRPWLISMFGTRENLLSYISEMERLLAPSSYEMLKNRFTGKR